MSGGLGFWVEVEIVCEVAEDRCVLAVGLAFGVLLPLSYLTRRRLT